MDTLVSAIFMPTGRLEGLVTRPELLNLMSEGKVTTKTFSLQDGKTVRLFVLTDWAIEQADAGYALFNV